MPSTIIDNGDSGYSDDGWPTTTYAPGYYGTNYARLSPGGSTANKAFWTFTGLTPGTTYYLGLHWPAHLGAHAPNAPWKVHDGNSSATVIATGTSDTGVVPADFTDSGFAWQFLGGFQPSGTSLTIERNGGDSAFYTPADAALLTATLPAVTPATVQAGDWNTGSTWNIGSVPSASSNGLLFRHPLTLAASKIQGDGTNNLVLDFSNANSSLTIATGCTLTLKGNAQSGTNTYNGGVRTWLTLNGTAKVSFDGNSGVTPHWDFGRQAKLVMAGTDKNNRAEFETKSGSAGNQGYLGIAATAVDTLQHNLSFAKFTRLGSLTQAPFTSQLCIGGEHLADDVIFDGCGQVGLFINDDGAATLHWNRVKFINEITDPPSTFSLGVAMSGNIPLTSGTRLIERCTFTSRPTLSLQDGTVDDNVFADWMQAGTADPFSNNLFIKNDGDISGCGPNLTGNYWYATFPFTAGWGGTAASGIGLRQYEIWDPGTQLLPGCHFISEGSTAHTTFRHCLALPGAGRVVNFNANRNPEFSGADPHGSQEHCTSFMVGDVPASGGGLTVGLKANSVNSFKSNLLAKLSAATGNNFAFRNDDTGIIDGVQGPLEALTAANCDYNGLLNVNISNNYAGNSHSTPYDTPMPTGSTAPGTHDVILSASPFVDATRNLITWGASLGSANEAETLAHLIAQHDTSDPDYDARYTTAALYAWVSAGYEVTGSQGLLLKDAGHDGVTIGAIPFSSPSGTLSDTFTGTAQNLTSHTSDSGHTYTRLTTGGTPVNGNILLNGSGQVYGATNNNDESVYLADWSPGQANASISWTAKRLSLVDGEAVSVFVRASGSSFGTTGDLAGYEARYTDHASNAGLAILVAAPGGATVLTNTTITPLSDGDVLKLDATGSTISIYVNNVLALQTTDGTISAAGFVGLKFHVKTGGGTDSTGMQIDALNGSVGSPQPKSPNYYQRLIGRM